MDGPFYMLHAVFRNQPEESFTNFVSKASSEALSCALTKKTRGGQTSLDICIKEQNWNATLQLINKVSNDALTQCRFPGGIQYMF